MGSYEPQPCLTNTSIQLESYQSQCNQNEASHSSQLFVPKADGTCSRDWYLFKQLCSTYTIEIRGQHARDEEAGYNIHLTTISHFMSNHPGFVSPTL